jgi:hypothetical protein
MDVSREYNDIVAAGPAAAAATIVGWYDRVAGHGHAGTSAEVEGASPGPRVQAAVGS